MERARTQAEIDAELARWGDVPVWPVTPTEPPDPYGWLYRAPRQPDPAGAPEPFDEDGPATEPFVPLGVAARPTAVTANLAAPVAVRPRARRARRPLLTVVTLAVCASLGAAAALVAVNLVTRNQPTAGPTVPSAPASASASPTSPVPGMQWTGATAAITGVSAEATCVAPPSKDSANQTVRYDPANLVDNNPATAWRCDADLTPTLTLTVPATEQIAAVGLINGYAKVDPGDRTDRYPLYRRVLQVRWTLPNGTTVEQTLADEQTQMQVLSIPVCGGGRVKLEVLRTTNPSSNAVSRDAVVISEVTFLAPKP